MISVGHSTWRGRKDVESILREISEAYILKNIYINIYIKVFNLLPRHASVPQPHYSLLGQGREYLKARRGDKSIIMQLILYGCGSPVWLAYLFALPKQSEALLAFLCIRPQWKSYPHPCPSITFPQTCWYKLKVEEVKLSTAKPALEWDYDHNTLPPAAVAGQSMLPLWQHQIWNSPSQNE